MNNIGSPSRLSMIMQGLAHSLPMMFPPIILCAIGFTFALMVQQQCPKAARLTKIGCLFLGLSPVISKVLMSYQVIFSYEGSAGFVYSLIHGVPSFIGIVCLVIAAFTERPSGRDKKPPSIR